MRRRPVSWRGSTRRSSASSSAPPGRAAKSFAEHEAIVEAIRAHDPVRARAAMTRHLAHVVTGLSEAIVSQGLQGSLAASHVAFAGAD